MEKFCVVGFATVGTNKTLANIYNAPATPTCRGKIFDFTISSYATPADQATQFVLQRSTANGTGTSFTPNNLDPAGPAGAMAAAVNHSGEPTYTSAKQLWRNSVNQRGTWRMSCNPGAEFLIPATQNAGIGLFSLVSTGTPTCDSTIFFEE